MATFGGQLCTKPGVVFVPAGAAGDAFVADVAARLEAADPQVMLNERLRDALVARVDELAELAEPAAADGAAGGPEGPGFRFAPAAYRAAAADLAREPGLLEERFGPVVLLLGYRSEEELLEALDRVEGQLTGSLHAEPEDEALVLTLVDVLAARAGRLVFDGFPTGVAVTHGMTHGGPYPATTAPGTTSVGMTAIARFLRPGRVAERARERRCRPRCATRTRSASGAGWTARRRASRSAADGLQRAEDVALGVLEVGELPDVRDVHAVEHLLAAGLGHRALGVLDRVDLDRADEAVDRGADRPARARRAGGSRR